MTAELSRLSAENARLREALSQAEKKSEFEHVSEMKDLWERMAAVNSDFHYKRTKRDQEWSIAKKVSLAYCFLYLSPAMVTEISVDAAGESLAMYVGRDGAKVWWTVAHNQVRGLFADFMALGLAEPSKRKHAVSDSNEYWTLTDLGRDLQRLVRQRMLERRKVPATGSAEGQPPAITDTDTTGKTPTKKAAAKKATAKKATAKKARKSGSPRVDHHLT